jgi:hypothetical protein
MKLLFKYGALNSYENDDDDGLKNDNNDQNQKQKIKKS